jgi:hypothetical protein
MSKATIPNNANSIYNESLHWSKYSDVSKIEKGSDEYLINGCRRLTNSIYDGLDLRVEIMSVIKQKLGDIVLIYDPDSTNNTTSNNRNIAGFAICHCGAGTEAGSNTCYIKFAAVQPPTSDNESNVISVFHGIYTSQRGIAQTEIPSQSK